MPIPRCEAIPQPDNQVQFLMDGRECFRWHFGQHYPRPFLFPLVSPSGAHLTRMGHPGAPNHDHHRSVWFAHHKVLGINFWGDTDEAQIRQHDWLAIEESDTEATLAVRLGWHDGHDPKELLLQELVIALVAATNGEYFVELQSRFIPVASELEFQQTNFGFLAVRVARSLSEHFGDGQLTGTNGRTGEPALFEQPSHWIDYSGPTSRDSETVEGITYVDHPDNPGQPTRWHVRRDGWMGAAPCQQAPLQTTQQSPLSLRYRLHVHQGPVNSDRADQAWQEFAATRPFRLTESDEPHRHSRIRRSE